MTIQIVNIGISPNDDTGDDPRTVGQKLNSNFQTASHAASREVGGGAGNLMEVGAFGLGADATRWATTDLNDIDKSGLYDIDGSDANVPSGGGHLIHSENSAEANATQIYTDIVEGRSYFRVKANSTFQAWQEIFHTGNLDIDSSGGLGKSKIMRNFSGASIAADATIAGGSLRFAYFLSTGNIAIFGAAVGTWKNTSGGTLLLNDFGEFTRIA